MNGLGYGSPTKRRLSFGDEPDTKRQKLIHQNQYESNLNAVSFVSKKESEKKVEDKVNEKVTYLFLATQLRSTTPHNPPQARPICPPPPSKSRNTLFERIYTSAQSGSVKIGSKMHGVSRAIAKGGFMNVYECLDDQESLIKVFHNHSKVFNDKMMHQWMVNSLENYRAVEQLNLPVSKIWNEETALEDKCYKVEKIAGKVDLGNVEHLKQIRQFFKVTLRKSVLREPVYCDLSLDNLRVKEGKVTLIDFTEENPSAKKFGMFAMHYLKSYGQEVKRLLENSEMPETEKKALTAKLLTKLTRNIEGFDPTWIQLTLS